MAIDRNALTTRVKSQLDLILFEEAFRCLESECYRSSYIIGWLSVVESLKRKIYKLADSGVAVFETEKNRIIHLESSKKSTDLQIIQSAHTVGLIVDAQKSKLDLFWASRCLFAHPYESAPQIHEIEYLLSEAVEISLGKSTLHRRAMIDEFISNLVGVSHFVPADQSIIFKKAEGFLSLTDPEQLPYFFKSIHFEIGKILDSSNGVGISHIPETKKLRTTSIAVLLSGMKNQTDYMKWGLANRILKFPVETFYAAVHYRTWKMLSNENRVSLLEYFTNSSNSDYKQELRGILFQCLSNEVFELSEKCYFYNDLASVPIVDAFDWYLDSDPIKIERIISALSNYGFSNQNSGYGLLHRDLEKTISLIAIHAPELQRKLGQYVAHNEWKGNTNAKAFSSAILENDDHIKLIPWFAAGCAQNAFLSKDSFEFKFDKLEEAITLLDKIWDTVGIEIYDQIQGSLVQGVAPIYWNNDFIENEYSSTKSKLHEKLQGNVSHQAKLSAVLEDVDKKVISMGR